MPRSRRKRGIESGGVQVRDCGLRAREVWQAPDGRLRCSQRKPIIRSALLLLSLACSRRRPRSDGKQREREERYPSCCARRRKRATASVRGSVSVHVTIGAPTTNPPSPRSLSHLLPRRAGCSTKIRENFDSEDAHRSSLPLCHSKAASTAADSQKLLRRRGGHTRIHGQGFPLSHHLASNPPSALCLLQVNVPLCGRAESSRRTVAVRPSQARELKYLCERVRG